MSAGAPDLTPPPDWADLLGETRAILQLDDDPVPVEELVETAVDHGYGTDVDGLPPKKAVRRALRDADVLEAAGDLDYVRLADETAEPSDSGDIEGRGAGSSGDDPQGETDESGEANGAAALDDAVEWFTDQLDRTIDDHTESGDNPGRPTTAREWFTDVRGYDEATVEEKRLGWAPAGAAGRLVEYLHRNGHGREAILATGLFTEDLRLLWNGRYVFPYLNRDGRAAYAIGRTTGSLGGGGAGYDGHPEDFLAGKYAKLAHTRDYVTVEEPIYGLGSLDRDTPVLITEGVADAVRAHEAGYACLSPVTTQFKKEHREQLVDVLNDTGRRAYIVQDAERPVVEHSEEGEGWDALAVEQYGEGVKGAARTAAFLTDAGVEAYLAELPRLGLDKVDLDDYLGEWADTLAPVLAGAKPGDEHPAYAETAPSVSPSTSASGAESWGGSEASSSGGSGADLTRADIRDALDHVSSTLSYDEWIQLGYAVHAWDGGKDDEDGKEVFTEWSKQSPKWEEPTSPNAIDWIWSNASGVEESAEGKVTVGTLIARAKKGGWEPPRRDDPEEYDDDPRDVSATVDLHRAWDAAGRVTPSDLETDALNAVGDAFACPTCGSEVDVVRAVAVREGLAECCDGALDAEAYPEAYALAREEYDAPLPEYYTTADAIAEYEAVLDVIGEVRYDHLNADAIATETTATGSEVSGDAVRTLDPAWRHSNSGESVLVFDSGLVWDADTERVLDALRFVALDSGLLDDPTDPLEGETFTEAYRRARTEYGAPLPRWEPALDGARDLTPQLPPAEDLLDARKIDGVGIDDLEAARDEVEALIREAARDADTPTVVTALPALGKTTGTIKTARDRPLSYLAPRKELQQQALDKADEWGVDAFVLPVFAGERVRDEVLDAATAYVREHDKTPLRERWSLLEAAVDGADEDVDPGDIFTEDDEETEEEVALDRATCPTADGDHGVAWALAFHVARRLGYTPRQIHRQARGLFGAEPPCEHDHGEDSEDADTSACAYSAAWEEAADAEDPYDLLVGSYTHAHVDSVRTAYDTGPDGETERNARTVVLDEFVGEAYAHGFDDHADDHARWLASALREDVADRRDMYEADLFGDEWVRAWLRGEGETVDVVDDALATLGRLGDLFDAREGAAAVLDEVDRDLLDTFDLETPLAQLVGGDDPPDVCRDLEAALGSVDRHHPAAGVAEWVADAVAEPLARATDGGATVPSVEAVDLEALPVAGDLADLVADAVEAVAEDTEGAEGQLRAAVTALRGGRDGCEVLAAWADDGYAHPDAHHLLEAIATPTSADAPENATRVETSAWAFDPEATDGTTVDVVETSARATVVLDRNGHGARLHNPPARTHAGGEETPLVGLDATGRAELWRVALGEPVGTADIHDTPAERAAFLEDALDLRVLQAADRPRYYSGDPGTKDTDGDAALLEAIAEEYAGIDVPRRRGGTPEAVGRPAAITSKGVREVLENDARLNDVVAEWEHFGNLAGANDLGDHRLGAVLGCQHYGDDAIERFAALDGEAVDVSRDGVRGRGAELSYDSVLGDEYLQHMTEDQVLQAILRFARGDSGATVVARTSALSPDLPVVGEGQVVETWSDTATEIARRYRRLGDRFTVADVADAVDVSRRQVRRVLAELEEAGYVDRVSSGAGVATVYAPGDQPGAGEVDLAAREDAVDATAGRDASKEYYTWNVRVAGGKAAPEAGSPAPSTRPVGAPPAPEAVEVSGPPG